MANNIALKLSLGSVIALMAIAVTTAAAIGAVSGIVMGATIASCFPNLLPMIAGGIIGLGISPLYWIVFTGPLVVLFSPIQFGIGVGLTALGFTSPAAIGALSAGLTAAIPFLFVLACIGIGSSLVSHFMGEEEFTERPSSRFDEGISFSNVFDERADTQGFNRTFNRDFGFSRPDNVFGRMPDTIHFGFPNRR